MTGVQTCALPISGMVKSEYSINDLHEEDSVDLCYECADWIIKSIRNKSPIWPK